MFTVAVIARSPTYGKDLPTPWPGRRPPVAQADHADALARAERRVDGHDNRRIGGTGQGPDAVAQVERVQRVLEGSEDVGVAVAGAHEPLSDEGAEGVAGRAVGADAREDHGPLERAMRHQRPGKRRRQGLGSSGIIS